MAPKSSITENSAIQLKLIIPLIAASIAYALLYANVSSNTEKLKLFDEMQKQLYQLQASDAARNAQNARILVQNEKIIQLLERRP